MILLCGILVWMFASLLPLTAVGILIGLWWGTGMDPILVGAVALFASAGALVVAAFYNTPRVAGCGFLTLALVAGALWGDRASQDVARARAAWKQHAGDVLVLEGAVQLREERGQSARIRMGDIVNLPGRIEFWVPADAAVREGDTVVVRGSIAIPEVRAESGTFRPAEYYARHDVFALVNNARVVAIQAAHTGRHARDVPQFLRDRINAVLPEPSAGFVSAILTGDRTGIPPDMREAFATAGVAHLIAISGLHTGLLAAAAFFSCAAMGLHRRIAVLIAVLFAALFVAGAGFPPSGVRAFAMVSLVLLAYSFGRRAHTARVLLFAAALMAIMDPRIVRADIGFQLSVAAMWGIAAWYPLFWPLVPDHIGLRSIRVVVLITLAATITTAPLVSYAFGYVSVIGLVVNVIITPLFPVVMAAGAAALAAGTLPLIGSGIAAAAHWSTSIFIYIITNASEIPGAAFLVSLQSTLVLFVMYAALFVIPIMFVPAVRAQIIPDAR